MICKMATVKKIAIGSLLPDSSSNKGESFFFKEIPFALSIAKTAAASVDEIIAPKSKDYKKVKSSK